MTGRKKRLYVYPMAPRSHTACLSHLHPITAQLLYNRGIIDPAEVDDFLRGNGRESDPYDLADMGAAVARIRRAIEEGERIAVYGDYDADGVTATALVVQTLRALGGQVVHYIPNREDEGYGLHEESLEELARQGVQLVVTVDCGVRSVSEVAFANQIGLDVVVTDHHSVGTEMPPAVAIINPKREENCRRLDELAGVGVAFKLAQALLVSTHDEGPGDDAAPLNAKDLLDLVAIGTIADIVPLTGENRTLVKRGLERLNPPVRPGIHALVGKARLQPGRIDATAVGFGIAPRINAAGRIDHADAAFELLDTQFPAEAERLADRLDQLNRERRALTTDTENRARELALPISEDAPLLIAAAPDLPSGIAGLAASRLTDEFYRPAVVVSVGETCSRGSARSIPEFHITMALDQCADLLVRHGGHAAAAGFTVTNEHLKELESRLQEIAADALRGRELIPALTIDAEIELSQLTWDLQEELARLEPHGCGNPAPLFLSRDVRVADHRVVGSNRAHLKLRLSNGGASWDAIAFRQGDWADRLPDRINVVYHFEVNEWNGRRELQLNVQHIEPAQDSAQPNSGWGAGGRGDLDR
ncbi:MAG: single-stranded-DNA-specific exonuclease RecJ [Chloroflexi bacterium]|nr:single-stranded-DNA-specific exonuclease RecJ [Chloroflexota bacterium]